QVVGDAAGPFGEPVEGAGPLGEQFVVGPKAVGHERLPRCACSSHVLPSNESSASTGTGGVFSCSRRSAVPASTAAGSVPGGSTGSSTRCARTAACSAAAVASLTIRAARSAGRYRRQAAASLWGSVCPPWAPTGAGPVPSLLGWRSVSAASAPAPPPD